MKTILLIAIAAAVVLFVLRGRLQPPKKDERAHELVEAGGTLVDVRSPGEFGRGHVEGAINIPVDELKRRMSELGAKDTPVVVYCASGMRSAQAKRMLEGAGFQTVHDMKTQGAW
jgi:rhodanese-related sulfurtransferase